jgi:hypothetical protein
MSHQSHNQPPAGKYHQHLQLIALLLEVFDFIIRYPEKLNCLSDR